jgi:hypothetical protein
MRLGLLRRAFTHLREQGIVNARSESQAAKEKRRRKG